MTASELRDLAVALKSLLVRYDNLWQMSFPYVLTLHQAPTDGADYSGIPFPHRVPPAAAQAEPAEVPRRPRDRRRQLPERHAARVEGGGAARGVRRALPEQRRTACVIRARCLKPILELHRRVRDEIVAATERRSVERWPRSIVTTRATPSTPSTSSPRRSSHDSPKRSRASTPSSWWPRGCPAAAVSTRAERMRRRPTGGSSSTRSTARAA